MTTSEMIGRAVALQKAKILTDSEAWPDATPVPNIPGFWACDGFAGLRIDLPGENVMALIRVVGPDQVVQAFQHPRRSGHAGLMCHAISGGAIKVWTSSAPEHDIAGPALIYMEPGPPEYAPKEMPRIRVLPRARMA